MKLKANYRELEDISSFVYKKTEDLEKDLKDIIVLIGQINGCWKGIDAENFILNSATYVKNININVVELKNISNLIKTIATKYSEKDLNFEKEIQKEGLKNEKY